MSGTAVPPPPPPRAPRAVTAKYGGSCPVCRRRTRPGETVFWAPGRRAVCATCQAHGADVERLTRALLGSDDG
jgi:hypothetical protein